MIVRILPSEAGELHAALRTLVAAATPEDRQRLVAGLAIRLAERGRAKAVTVDVDGSDNEALAIARMFVTEVKTRGVSSAMAVKARKTEEANPAGTTLQAPDVPRGRQWGAACPCKRARSVRGAFWRRARTSAGRPSWRNERLRAMRRFIQGEPPLCGRPSFLLRRVQEQAPSPAEESRPHRAERASRFYFHGSEPQGFARVGRCAIRCALPLHVNLEEFPDSVGWRRSDCWQIK